MSELISLMLTTLIAAAVALPGQAAEAGAAIAKATSKMAVIQQWQVHEPVEEKQLDDSAYETCRKIGITSLQSYVGWAQLEPERGKVTYAVYDPVVDKIRKHGLKWLPFIITSPYIATPEWFRKTEGVEFVCLEHNKSIAIQSIWNPKLRAGIRRYLGLFKAHYDAGVIEALNLGVSGNWGESIMPVGGGFDMEGAHTHGGWWCGDRYARADFACWTAGKYRTIEKLNSAWKTGYEGFDDVRPFIPSEAPSRRAAVDLADWYMQSMTDYAEFWVKTARELYPDLPIYVCTGGSGQPHHGADFAAQAKMCAKYDAGIRVTNQGDHAGRNFADTRMVSSATRLYGGYYATEPGGPNSPKGIAGRIFDLISGGAVGVYFKQLIDANNRTGPNGVKFVESAHYLAHNVPNLAVAAVMPNSSIALDKESLRTFMARAIELRDALDFEFIDENMIGDALLDRFAAVVVLSGDTLESGTLAKLREWVEAGGVLMAPAELLPLKTVEGDPVDWTKPPASDRAARVASVLDSDPAEALRLVSQSLGKGYLVFWPGEWDSYRRALNLALHAEADASPWKKQLAEPIDCEFDNVLACRAGDDLYFYNNTDEQILKRMPGGRTIQIRPRSITKAPAALGGKPWGSNLQY